MKSTEYYLSKGLDQSTAAYFAAGRRTIVSVTASSNFTVLLLFDNGEWRSLDLKSIIQPGTVFAFLADPSNFDRVYLDENKCVSWDIDPNVDSTKVWSNKVDLSPDTCYLDSVPVLSQNLSSKPRPTTSNAG